MTEDSAPRIGDRDIHLWIANVDAALDRHSEDALLAVLDPADRRACARAIVAPVRRERIVSRAMVRLGLSWYLDRPPYSWRIATTDLGRPELLVESGLPDLRFNLSHSGGLVACAFALGREVGVDVEHRERPLSRLDEVARYLSASERTDWLSAPDEARKDLFLRYWTLKEAYAKAKGGGLSIGFERFSIDLRGPRPALVDELSGTDEGSRWHFQEWTLPAHTLAVAAELLPGEKEPLDPARSREALHSRLRHMTDLLVPPNSGR